MTNLLIMVAPNGARLNKSDHPKVPITISETITAARHCFDVGASALHLHVRDNDGAHSLDAGRYKEAIQELTNAVPAMRIQITTEAVGVYSVAEQLHCIKSVGPDWVSISVREIARSPELASSVYASCADMESEVQHILYDHNDALLLQDWQSKGIVHERQNSVLLVLGRYTKNQVSNPEDVRRFLSSIPKSTRWMLCAFGAGEHACLEMAANLGGDCRVGFENSQINATGVAWQDNAASVSTLVSKLSK